LGEALGELGINGTFLLAQIVNFSILLGIMSIFLWKPLMERLDERREMMREQRENAEAIAETREEIQREREAIMEEARTEANELLGDTRAQTREMTENAREEAREEAQRILDTAREQAEEERNAILGQMRDQIATLAVAAARKLVDEDLDEQRQRRLVDAFFSGIREGRVQVLPEGGQRPERPVQVISAIPLKEEEQETIRQELIDKLGEGVEVNFQVDPEILGGLVIRVGDRVIDGSVAGQLQQLEQSLT
jgi:F-type H+-transporting ATPase subunit b